MSGIVVAGEAVGRAMRWDANFTATLGAGGFAVALALIVPGWC